jgi:hypothetical protein
MFLFLSICLGTAGARANLNKLWLIGSVMAWRLEIGRVRPLCKMIQLATKEEQEDIKRVIAGERGVR